MAGDLKASDFKVEANLDAGETLNKKIRNAQLAHYNFILGKLLRTLNSQQFLSQAIREKNDLT